VLLFGPGCRDNELSTTRHLRLAYVFIPELWPAGGPRSDVITFAN